MLIDDIKIGVLFLYFFKEIYFYCLYKLIFEFYELY